MKRIKKFGVLGIRYAEYKCPHGLAPGECPNLYECWGNVVKNEYKDSDCIYTKKSK